MERKLDLTLVRQALRLLDRRGRIRLALFAGLNLIASLFDVIGVAAILPLVQIMAGQSYTDGYLGVIHGVMGEPSRSVFVTSLAVIIVLAFTLKAAGTLALTWFASKFSMEQELQLQRRLLSAFLDEPFARHRQRSTAEISRTVSAAVGDTYRRIIGGVMQLISQGLSVGVLFVFLLIVVPIPTLVAVAFFGVTMIALDRALAPIQRRSGEAFMAYAWQAGRALMESAQGFREVRMHNRSKRFVDRYSTLTSKTMDAARRSDFVTIIPRYALELVAITGIALVLAVLAWTQTGEDAIGSLALFVGASIKILPNIAAINATVSGMHRGVEGTSLVLEALSEFEQSQGGQFEAPGPPLERDSDISVNDVSFTFPDGIDPVLDGVTLHIPHGTSLALCGSSGSGKTTLVDTILGLQVPTLGTVTYGGEDVQGLGGRWRAIVGYIPQDVFLLDDTVSANVAFGVPEEVRDHQRIDECLRLAQLTGVVAEMPEGLNTAIGERGTKLSGGQRQRIGIARALYPNPSVLVLDEATSALDNETEHSIVQTIASLSETHTVIIVAHRLSTVKDVDQLVFLEAGRVAARGTFEEVRRSNERFAELVRLGDLGGDDS